MGAELCVDEAAVAMAVTEALERSGSVSVGRKSAETVRSWRRFADRCRPADPPAPRSEPAPTCCGPEDEDEEETASLSVNEAVSRGTRAIEDAC